MPLRSSRQFEKNASSNSTDIVYCFDLHKLVEAKYLWGMQSKVAGSLAVGIFAGVVGTLAMATAQQLITSANPSAHKKSKRLRRSGAGSKHWAQSEPRSHEHPLSTSEYLVERFAPNVTRRQRDVLGSLIHYGFGAGAGAAYLLALQTAPPGIQKFLRSGYGLTYGTLVWLIADEIGVPLARIAPPPQKTPLRLHIYSLASHFAFGIGLESVRRMMEAVVTRPASPSAR
jgi:hypothetical protein